MSNAFGIGIAQPSGNDYTYTIDTTISQPRDSVFTLAPAVGLDGYGAPVVRGFGNQVWSYPWMAINSWFYIVNIFKQSRYQAQWGRVAIQWPDPESGTMVIAIARFEPPTVTDRDLATMHGVALTFSHIGEEIPASPVGYWLRNNP